ncbi:class I SAM-dependent methyltransferase [Paraburkholderia sp. SEWSISQ10-3 4]|uniref:class I SAM-dependent methyltransferase n=1 Tax=Paraburkholderia TaxID=1822464 RepID=UPI00225092E1|nr:MULTISPECIES: class I SAM-dependent methyltransferase [Paraburkholderia]MCX4137739.1 class I SAM-dependent methyltransferase [Paraburkholderia aspalathi]MDN7170430.1 class I SAM-dependent methyltransferase [Paraburkholderia sp. SEWSISQ10-3 4]MDQ6500069.1 class I SAM-dependent methyltransferase [Paraburkholderia aspalathi]
MSEWEAGSIDGIAYTYGYCDELDPLRLRLPLLQSGIAPPTLRTACELGFGHGVSVNIHAAGSTTRWFGTDFNPSHASFAQQLKQCAGSQASLFAESFAEFCRRDELPKFDFIGMHGIWSWISDENRALIADFIRRKLNDGGVVYMSYNTQPGWATMLPVRELMNCHFQVSARLNEHGGVPAETQVQTHIAAALDFVKSVVATQPGYAVVNPQLAERVDALSKENTHYLAHEYFNRDWQPMTFSQVTSSLAASGLTYSCSADYRDHVDEINLNPAQRALLAGVPDTALRETVRDFCINRSMRRDYWVKGSRTLGEDEQQMAMRAHRVMLALPRASVLLKIRGALGEATLPESSYGPILDALASHQPARLVDIENSVRGRGITLPFIVKAVTLLVGAGVLLNVQEEAHIELARPSSDRLNAAICEQALQHGDVQFLVSPVSGSGVLIPRVPQLFLLARRRHLREPAQWAEFAEAALHTSPTPAHAMEGFSVSPLNTRDDLIAKANRFAEMHLPILQALGIA